MVDFADATKWRVCVMVGRSHVVAYVLGWKIAQKETLSNHYIRMEVTFHLQGEYSDFITDHF